MKKKKAEIKKLKQQVSELKPGSEATSAYLSKDLAFNKAFLAWQISEIERREKSAAPQDKLFSTLDSSAQLGAKALWDNK